MRYPLLYVQYTEFVGNYLCNLKFREVEKTHFGHIFYIAIGNFW